MSSSSYDDLFASASGFQVTHKTQFVSGAGEALRLTVRQDVKSRAGLKQLGRSILVFDFEPVGAITPESSPTSTGGSAAAVTGTAQEAAGGARGRGEGAAEGAAERDERRTGERTSYRGSCVVFAHDRYNGAKQLYLNRALVYSVEKECTDGNLNSWVLPLPFGRAVLRLTSKFFSSSGFEYSLTLGDGGPGLYKSKR